MRSIVSIFSLPSLTYALSSECQRYLDVKGMGDVWQLKGHFDHYSEGNREYPMPCQEDFYQQSLYMPNPAPYVPGSMDTSDLSCRYGNIAMWGGGGASCCGVKPHFNWVVGTCEAGSSGQFCRNVPACATSSGVQINYVAAYQFDGAQWVMMDDSTAGNIEDWGVYGNHAEGTGWESAKNGFGWQGGDWNTKYAPWARGNGPEGPRGLTPPGALWILSAENFYYGAFYMLTQLTLNLAGKGMPTGTNCWTWELDPVEGAGGWNPSGPTPGNLNQLYATSNAQSSGCMPLAHSAKQTQANQESFSQPEIFRGYCAGNPNEPGCSPWQGGHNVQWSGGSSSTHRFENLWGQPYVFAVVIDADGYWTYRWIPEGDGDGTTGWPGVNRYSAQRTLPSNPRPVTNPAGLKTDVEGHVPEAVILQPSSNPSMACQRSSIEQINWEWGAGALGSMAFEMGENRRGGALEGAQNWWAHFANTGQYANYPISISGVPSSELSQGWCKERGAWSCECHLASEVSNATQVVV